MTMEAVIISKDDRQEIIIVTGLSATEAARVSAKDAAKKFAKPQEYTGSRTLYDSGSAKHQAKMSLFRDGAEVRDPYTGDILTLTKAEAKARFGADWQKHLAESDHVHPLERIHSEHKSDAFVTNENIRDAANSPDNMQVTSRQLNNAKRSRTNEEFMRDSEYRKRKGITLSEEAESRAVRRGSEAASSVDSKLFADSVRNVASTFHNAGLAGAKCAGLSALTAAGIMNAVAVLKGDKDPVDAVADTLKTGGVGALTGYVTSGGLTVLSHKLSYASNELVKRIASSNLPGQIITAVMTVGGTLKRYASGEIDTGEFILELGEKGAGFAAGSYGFAVGGIIGSMVGYALSGAFYGSLVENLNAAKFAREERIRVERECAEAVKAIREFRAKLEALISQYFTSHITTFHAAFDAMKDSLSLGDIDGFISGANMITEKLGRRVQFRNMREFDALMDSDEAFVL